MGFDGPKRGGKRFIQIGKPELDGEFDGEGDIDFDGKDDGPQKGKKGGEFIQIGKVRWRTDCDPDVEYDDCCECANPDEYDCSDECADQWSFSRERATSAEEAQRINNSYNVKFIQTGEMRYEGKKYD